MNQCFHITRLHKLHCPQCDESNKLIALRADVNRVTVRCKLCGHTWPSAGKGAWHLWNWTKDKAGRKNFL